jgi:nucleotide-binding universal stress UspA family protein
MIGTAAATSHESVLAPGKRVLVPLVRGQSAASLLSIGDAIAAHCPSRGIVLSLVEIPTRWSNVVASAVVRSRELLRWIAANDYVDGGLASRLSIQSRFTTDPVANIRESMLETGCDLVVLEYPSSAGRRRHRLHAMLDGLSGAVEPGLVVVRPDPRADGGAIRPRSVLVPLRGGGNAALALRVGLAVAAHAGSDLTLLHVYDRRHHPDLRRHEAEVFHELAREAAPVRPGIVELVTDNPNETLLAAAADHDAVVLGAHADPLRRGLLIGDELAAVMDRLKKTVIVARGGLPTRMAA